jgi:hypothetical protein
MLLVHDTKTCSAFINFYRELRSPSEKILNPDRVSRPSPVTGKRNVDCGIDSKGHLSAEPSEEDTGEV